MPYAKKEDKAAQMRGYRKRKKAEHEKMLAYAIAHGYKND